MTWNRHVFPINVSGGAAKGDTGRLYGRLEQMRWYPDTADTGQIATMSLAVIPQTGDTGPGFAFYSQGSLNLGAAFTKAPRQASHNAAGAAIDTGDDFSVPVVGAGDRLRLKVVPADTGVVIDGDLFVWVRD